jgi:hypothetical protein
MDDTVWSKGDQDMTTEAFRFVSQASRESNPSTCERETASRKPRSSRHLVGSAGLGFLSVVVLAVAACGSSGSSGGFTAVRVTDATPDQVVQTLQGFMPLAVEEATVAPATCEYDTLLPGLTVLPIWNVYGGEYQVACDIRAGSQLYVNVAANIWWPDEGTPEETLVEDLEASTIEELTGDNPPYEAVLTIDGETMPTLGVVTTEKFTGTPPEWWGAGETNTFASSGYNAIVELPAGQHTIVSLFRSLEDGTVTSVTYDLNVAG